MGRVERSTFFFDLACQRQAQPKWQGWGLSHVVSVMMCAFLSIWVVPLQAQENSLSLQREGRTISLEPYAPNVLRVTLSTDPSQASGPPGYGFIAKPSSVGWTHDRDNQGDIYKSDHLTVHVSNEAKSRADRPQGMPLDEINNSLRERYFGSGNGHGPNVDQIAVTTSSGKPLLTMQRWSMLKDASAKTAGIGEKEQQEGFHVSAAFDSMDGEHYYGLGQHQQGYLDLRGHRVNCWHNYTEIGGETLCVPFMISTQGYGIVWDNPSKTTVDLGINQQNVWSSQIGDRVSFFIIAGETSDEIYRGYRLLTGSAPLLPRPVYGYIQSKAIYPTQDQVLAVAKGYRDRKIPADTIVVDFLNMTRQGNMDLDPKRWPDPAGMNKQLHDMGFKTMISVWPHFAPGTKYYDELVQKKWLITRTDGTPDSSGYTNEVGPNIDSTNPEASKWWWELVRDNYLKADGFDYWWLDETEPDVDPEPDVFHIGSGKRFYNVYPLFHTAGVYDGYRRDFGDSKRCMILARATYTGAQRNGTVFWSSDIVSTWDMLKRSIPAGLGFTASGMPYWDTDIAGFFSPQLPVNYKPAHPPLIDPGPAAANTGRYTDYPELFVRWFEWGTFHPIMRAHGERQHNEIWSYGPQAEAILGKYLKLRYQLLPYTYSLAYGSYQTGAPYTRALFMDFPQDPKISGITDEYMYGPTLLIAPVVQQGATTREVYLPAGSDWFNFWTNERLKGGQTITVQAPIDTLPIFARAGSILPLGSEVQNGSEKQQIASIRVYPGADANFNLYADDGETYAYEKGGGSITGLHWKETSHSLTHDGKPAWTGSDGSIVHVIER